MSSPPLSDIPGPDAIVAVPVRNEEERIAACLRAIDAQEGAGSGRVGLVLFLLFVRFVPFIPTAEVMELAHEMKKMEQRGEVAA